MSYILIILLLFCSQSGANEVQNTRNINDSFDINIGAGYSVGMSPNNSPPNGTSNISLSKNYYSSSLTGEDKPHASVRVPRVLTNFTPQIGNSVSGQSTNQQESQSRRPDVTYDEFYPAGSNNIPRYNSPNFKNTIDEHFEQPNFVDFHKVLNDIESKKPFSKVLQVIKVPAIYEIHLQSESENDFKAKDLKPTENLFWKNYYGNKENEVFQRPGNDATWLSNYYLKGEEQFSKDGEKYYDFSDTPVVSYEGEPEYLTNDYKPEDNFGLPTRYSRTNTYSDDKESKVTYNRDSFNKSHWIYKDYRQKINPPNIINNFKRHIGTNSYSPYKTSQKKATSKPSQNNVPSFYSIGIKSSRSFKNNQIITENDKSQALHEVPAPILAKYPQPKPFEIQTASQTHSQTNISPPSPLNIYTKVKFNKLASSIDQSNHHDTPKRFLYLKPGQSFGKQQSDVSSSGKFPSYNGNSNLIYGKKNEHVLTPYEINIPLTPGSTAITVTERTNEFATAKSKPSYQYPSSLNKDNNLFSFKKPEMVNNKFNNYNKKLINIQQIRPNFEHYSISSKSDSNIFTTKPQFENFKTVTDSKQSSSQNVQSIKSTDNAMQIPEISNNNVSYSYQQANDVPCKIQKNIITDNSNSLKNNSNTVSTRNVKCVQNQDMEKIVKKDNLEQNMPASLTTPTKQNFRRRIFNSNYNMDFNGLTENGYISNNGMKQSKSFPRKNNDPQLDYIIYITRKSSN